MAQSKKDNPTRAALMNAGNIRRSESAVQETGALMGRTTSKEESQRLAIESRRAELRNNKPFIPALSKQE